MDFRSGYDVLVAGGGPAGVAAALQAARLGFKTALVEKTVLWGGLATAGLINVHVQLCDGRGHQVLYGLAEEFVHLSLRYGPGELPEGWRPGTARERRPIYMVRFSPASFVLALDEALEEAGVIPWLDTLACVPVMRGERVVGLEVENKSGRGLLSAKCVVDATGDADIAYRAGAPCVEEGNWLSVWAVQAAVGEAPHAVPLPGKASQLSMLRLGAVPSGRGQPPGMPKLSGTDGVQVTRFVLESRRLLRNYYREQYADKFSRETLYPVTLASMPQVRTTRRIVGQETVADGQYGVRIPTSIGLAPDWRQAGQVLEIPYGALLPQRVSGLLVVGRAISAERDAWEVTRVIPPAALTGQVAGVAAALAARWDTTPEKLAASDVQAELRKLGIPLHVADVVLEDTRHG